MLYKELSNTKVLVYDMETSPVLAWVWSCGEQYVRHNQLHDDFNETKIICITYQWAHKKSKPQALVADLQTGNERAMLEEFKELVEEADIVIGKNNTKFDDKHLNYRLFSHGLGPIQDFKRKSDDLETQIRRHFNVQSYGLDYISQIHLGEGKIKMELSDWIKIVWDKDQKALDKMVKYGKKDVADTVKLIELIWPYVSPKYNAAAKTNALGLIRCTNCGSTEIHKNGARAIGNTLKQRWYCTSHGGHAGYTTIRKDGESKGISK